MCDADSDAISRIFSGQDNLDDFLRGLDRIEGALPGRINCDPEKLEKGLAKLVLTLIELLRQLMERQAIRRMEGGSLTDDQVERLGQAFMRLERRMEELKQTFGLEDEELSIPLGPVHKI